MATRPHRRNIVVPKAFYDEMGMQAAGFKAHRTLKSRISGPLGSILLHGAVLALFFHFNAPSEVFGQRAVAEKEWIWLPEVTVVAEPPAPPPPVPEPAAPPEELMAVDSVAEELPAAVVADPIPAPLPEVVEPPIPAPVSEPAAADPSPADKPDVWTKVRTDIIQALRYPAYARREGLAGVVNVTIRLDEAGQVAAVNVTPPAPAQPLCDAVLTAVRHAGPFPAVGEAIRQGQSPDTAEIAIRFKLEDTDP